MELNNTEYYRLATQGKSSTFDSYVDDVVKLPSKIPTILHLIWIGPKELPPTLSTWFRGFMEVHPDWKLFLWRDADIDRFGLKNQQEYDKSKDYAGKADIARYEILYRYGGMYIDADTIWLSKLDVSQFTGSLNMTKEKVKSAEKKDSTLVCNGFIVTVPGHPFLKIAIDTLPQRFSEKNGQGAWIATGPRHLTRLHKLISPVVDKDIHFVVMNDFLGLDWWGDMTEAKTLEHADRCKREGVFSLHWGFSTNKLSIPGEGVSEEEAAKFSPFLVKQ